MGLGVVACGRVGTWTAVRAANAETKRSRVVGICDGVAVTASGPIWGPSRTGGAGKLGTVDGSDLVVLVAALAAATCIQVGSTAGGAGGGGGSLMCSREVGMAYDGKVKDEVIFVTACEGEGPICGPRSSDVGALHEFQGSEVIRGSEAGAEGSAGVPPLAPGSDTNQVPIGFDGVLVATSSF